MAYCGEVPPIPACQRKIEMFPEVATGKGWLHDLRCSGGVFSVGAAAGQLGDVPALARHDVADLGIQRLVVGHTLLAQLLVALEAAKRRGFVAVHFRQRQSG